MHISWTPTGGSELAVSIPYDRIIAHLLDGSYGETCSFKSINYPLTMPVEYEDNQPNGKITVLFESNTVRHFCLNSVFAPHLSESLCISLLSWHENAEVSFPVSGYQ